MVNFKESWAGSFYFLEIQFSRNWPLKLAQTQILGNFISNHPKKNWVCNPPSKNFQILPVVHLRMSEGNAKFQSNIVVLLDLWPVKDSPCRPMPSGQELHFCLAVFHKNYSILKMIRHISLNIWSLLNFRLLN